MAGYYAISTVTTALQGILLDALPAEFKGVAVEAMQIPDFQKAKPLERGVSVLLYRVAVSPMPRTLSGGFDAQGRRKLPPLPVDLYYLFSAWERTAATQQQLLGWLMRTLEDYNVLNATLLNNYAGPQAVFGDDETVSLVPESLALQDLANLWDILKPNVHPSVAYVARMIHLETLLELTAAEAVQTREYQYQRVRP